MRWSAPEALEDRKFNEKTDVWSFGVTCYEIWTRGRMPYEGWHNQKVWVQVSAGYRLSKPDDCDDEVYSFMLKCWAEHGADRPTFTQLTEFFRDQYAMINGAPLDGEYLKLGDESVSSEATPGKPSLFRRVSQLLGRIGTINPGYKPTSDQPSYMVPVNGRRSSTEPPIALYDVGEESGEIHNEPTQMESSMALYDMGDSNGNGNNNDAAMALYDLGNNNNNSNTANQHSKTESDDEQSSPTRTKNMPGRRSSASVLPSLMQLNPLTSVMKATGADPGKNRRESTASDEFGFGDDDDVDVDAHPLSLSPSVMDLMEAQMQVAKQTAKQASPRESKQQSRRASQLSESRPLELYGNVDTATKASDTVMALVKVGDRVKVQGYPTTGTVRFVGDHKQKGGMRYGVELDEPLGLNDGTIGGDKYFACSKPAPTDGRHYGVLVAPSKVTPLMAPQAWA